jgi:hypothetical protein
VPEVQVSVGDADNAQAAASPTGTAMIVVLADRGPVGVPVPITSLKSGVANFGPRVAYSPLYDFLEKAFRRGLSLVHVVRRVGPAAVVASKKIKHDAEHEALEVTATSPGPWANTTEVEMVEAAAGEFHVRVVNGDTLELSPAVSNNAAAVAWAARYSKLIRLKDLGGGNPALGKVTLAGGADDRANATGPVMAEGLELFGADLGFGQVSIPGNTDEAVQAAIAEHCAKFLRAGLIALEDSGDADDLIEQISALRSVEGAEFVAAFGAWDLLKGEGGTTRIVPPEARVSGAIADTDRKTGNPNQPAAGTEFGKDPDPIGLSQTYSPDDRRRLLEAGANISVVDDGEVMTDGWRSLADPVENRDFLPFSNVRLVLSMAAQVKRILKDSFYKQLDAQGATRASAENRCNTEVIKPAFANRAIYGETEPEAGRVIVEQDVNPADGSIGKLTGTLIIRPTGYVEEIEFTISVTNEAV